jgi:predicted PurR-regulated permease PerM
LVLVANSMRSRSGFSSHELVRILVFATLFIAVVAAVFRFRFLLLAALVGVFGGILLTPAIGWLERKWHLRRGIATALVALVGLVVTAVGIYFAWGVAADQVRGLIRRAPEITNNFIEAAQGFLNRLPGGGVDLRAMEAGPALQRTGKFLWDALHVGVVSVAGLGVMGMIALFVATHSESYSRGALTLFPPRLRARAEIVAIGCASVVRHWAAGQLLVMTITGAMTAVALALLGIEYWLVIAILTGLLGIIPFIGAFATGALAVAVTLGTEPSKVWWVLLAYTAVQQIESNLVIPLVMKGRVRLPEAHLLVFVLMMGAAFGILGVFAAPPLFGVLLHLYQDVYLPWIEDRVEPGARSAA